VAGGVVVVDGLAYFGAGRHGLADGGIHLYAAEPSTGKIVWHQRVQEGLILNLLASDGRSLGLGKRKGFDLKTGERAAPPRLVPRGDYDADLLDPTFVNRIYLSNGRVSGQWVASNKGWVIAIRKFRKYGYHAKYEWNVPGRGDWKLAGKRIGKGEEEWSVQVPLRMRAAVLAGETVFVAGAPEPIDPRILEAKAGKRWDLKRINQILAESPHLTDPKGGELWALSAAEGKKLTSLKLDAPPVFDGMAAAGGRLYLSTRDGRLLCFGKE